MEAKFRIKMKKNSRVLEDFILFTYRAKGGNRTKMGLILAVGMFAIAYMALKDGEKIGYAIAGLGVFGLIFTLFRHKIALIRLKKADVAYKNQTELEYVFTNGSIYVYEDGELAMNVGSYSRVSCLYEDEFNFYLGVNNEDLFLLPRTCFEVGNADEFVEFVTGKSGEEAEFLPVTWKNRWVMYRQKSKIAEAEYDAKAAKLREEAKQKRKRK
jgi:hypothetical protein